jgi:hypothetical protein
MRGGHSKFEFGYCLRFGACPPPLPSVGGGRQNTKFNLPYPLLAKEGIKGWYPFLARRELRGVVPPWQGKDNRGGATIF